jgi:hypothetical protein
MRKDFRTEPHDFVAEGDKLVVLTTVHFEGETVESADVLTYYGDGKLVAFDTLADETVPDRVFAKYSPHRGGHPPSRLTLPSARDRIQADVVGAHGRVDANDDAGFAAARLRGWCGSARRRPG